MSNIHESVLLNELVDNVVIKEEGIYLDATLGRGGHSKLILEKISKKNGQLIVFDQDIEAIDHFREYLSENKIENVILIKSNFKNIISKLKERNISKIDGIIFDLGVSSPQLDNPKRGFSYKNDGNLDMRMDLQNPFSAFDVINNYDAKQLNQIFYKYGEIKKPYFVSNEIIKQREIKPIDTTFELVDIIKKSINPKLLYKAKHPARQYFQAIRIEVNNEINLLKQSITDAISLLNHNSRVGIITFHSLEDKIVKHLFNDLTTSNVPKEIPIKNEVIPYELFNRKAILPTDGEIENNKRARSAKLRILIKK